VKQPSTGYFAVAKLGERWWFIDPAGHPYLSVAVDSVAPPKTFHDSVPTWIETTATLLTTNGFNSVGAWSDDAWADAKTFGKTTSRVPYTRIWNFMRDYSRDRKKLHAGTVVAPGPSTFPHDTIPVFDPEFVTFCATRAAELDATASDPYLLGHFSDNELPFHLDALKNGLTLPIDDPGNVAARRWYKAQTGVEPPAGLEQQPPSNAAAKFLAAIPASVNGDFVGYVTTEYFRIVSAAIQQHDKHHLFLGSRFNGRVMSEPTVFQAAGHFVDVVSVNYYGAWTPNQDLVRKWTTNSGRPVLISEFYAKGMDSNLPNTSGDGWIVRTQEDRGRFYQNFVLGLMTAGNVVGWQWFKYMDYASKDGKDDSNQGIVDAQFRPYDKALAWMAKLNRQKYPLVDAIQSK
jgi:hypothetical protein